MKRKHQKTLEAIFNRPTSGNIKWSEVESMLVHIGAKIKEREGSRVAIILKGNIAIQHRPHKPEHGQRGCQGPERLFDQLWSRTMTTMKLDDYIANLDYDEEIQSFHGRIINIRSVVNFYGKSASELKKAFKTSVNEYLRTCKEEGIPPDKPFSGRFNIRMRPEEHRELAQAAAAAGKSLNVWALETMKEAAEKSNPRT